MWLDVANDDRTTAYRGVTSNRHMIRNSDFTSYRDKISQGDGAANSGSGDDDAGFTDGTVMSNLYQVVYLGSIGKSCIIVANFEFKFRMMTIYSTGCLNTLIRGRQSLIPVSKIDKKAVKKGQARMALTY